MMGGLIMVMSKVDAGKCAVWVADELQPGKATWTALQRLSDGAEIKCFWLEFCGI